MFVTGKKVSLLDALFFDWSCFKLGCFSEVEHITSSNKILTCSYKEVNLNTEKNKEEDMLMLVIPILANILLVIVDRSLPSPGLSSSFSLSLTCYSLLLILPDDVSDVGCGPRRFDSVSVTPTCTLVAASPLLPCLPWPSVGTPRSWAWWWGTLGW